MRVSFVLKVARLSSGEKNTGFFLPRCQNAVPVQLLGPVYRRFRVEWLITITLAIEEGNRSNALGGHECWHCLTYRILLILQLLLYTRILANRS